MGEHKWHKDQRGMGENEYQLLMDRDKWLKREARE